jgi:hypothetical protein
VRPLKAVNSNQKAMDKTLECNLRAPKNQRSTALAQ